MPDFDRGTVDANGFEFHYLDGRQRATGAVRPRLPGLAVDLPLPAAGAREGRVPRGVRVQPRVRADAAPADRHHIHTSMMVADVLALHEALGGDGDAVLIAHDWGAVAAWGAAGQRPSAGGAA